MNRNLAVCLLMDLCALGLGTAALAQNAPNAGEPNRDRGPSGQSKAFMFSALADQLQLTADERAKYDAITAEYAPKLKAAQEANRERITQLQEKMRAAREANDDRAMKSVGVELNTLQEQTNKAITDQIFTQIKTVLTPEQQANLEELKKQFEPPPGPYTREIETLRQHLNLTAEQKPKFEALIVEFQVKLDKARQDNRDQMNRVQAKMQAAREARDEAAMRQAGQEMQALQDQAVKAIANQTLDQLKALLSPEQQTRLEELKAQFAQPRMARGPEMDFLEQNLNLTAEQRSKLEDAMVQYHQKMQALTDEFQGRIKAILTAEQLQKLEEARGLRQKGEAGAAPANPGKVEVIEGVVRSVDGEKKTCVLAVGEKEVTLFADKDTQFLDTDGKDAPPVEVVTPGAKLKVTHVNGRAIILEAGKSEPAK